MNSSSVLSVSSLWFKYSIGSRRLESNVNQSLSQNHWIFRDFSLYAKPGEIIRILGVSGSGKTTLLKLLAGIEIPVKGQILFRNVPIHSLDFWQRMDLRRTIISIIISDYFELHDLSLKELMNLYLQPKAIDIFVDYLYHFEIKNIGRAVLNDFSKGQQDLILILLALAKRPKLLLLDEPTSNLDYRKAMALEELLVSESKKHQLITLIATHDKRIGKNWRTIHIGSTNS